MSDNRERDVIPASVVDEAWIEYLYPRTATGARAEPTAGFRRAVAVFERWASAGLLQEPQPAGQQVSIPHHVSYLDANGDPGDCPDDPDRCPGCALEDRLVTAMQASQDRMRAKNLTYPEDEETQLFRLARIVLRELPPARSAVDDDTVERVARAIWADGWKDSPAQASDFNWGWVKNQHDWGGYKSKAEAAVRAMSGEGQ